MSKKKNRQVPEELATEWDLSEGMGILPRDKSLTHNIGCVGSNPKKNEPQKPSDLLDEGVNQK